MPILKISPGHLFIYQNTCYSFAIYKYFKQQNLVMSSDNQSKQKFKKFTTLHNHQNKREISVSSISKDSKSSIRSFRSISHNNSFVKGRQQRKKHEQPSVHHESLKQYLQPTRKNVTGLRKKNENARILQLVKRLIDEIKCMLKAIEQEVERSVDNALRNVKRQIFEYMKEKSVLCQEYEIQHIFENKTNPISSKIKVIRSQSITTSTQNNQHVPPKTSGFNHQIKLREELRKDVEKQVHIPKQQTKKEQESQDFQKQRPYLSGKNSMTSIRSDRSKNKSVSKEIRRLQDKIGSFKNILQK